MHEILLSVFDVARLLDKSPSTVRAYEQRGELPAMRTRDGTRIFRQKDVEEFVQRRRRGCDQQKRFQIKKTAAVKPPRSPAPISKG